MGKRIGMDKFILVGSGNNKLNPIHGADLAEVCVSAASGNDKDISVGGPQTYTHQDIDELAFAVLAKHLKLQKYRWGQLIWP